MSQIINRHIYYTRLTFSSYLFADECEKYFLLKGMEQVRSLRDFQIYAFCVMDDMIHFLIKIGSGGPDEIRGILKECLATMEGRGPQPPEERREIFSAQQGRFFIQEIRTTGDIVELIRYIHLLPVEYKYVQHPTYYWWSSFSCYRGKAHGRAWSVMTR